MAARQKEQEMEERRLREEQSRAEAAEAERRQLELKYVRASLLTVHRFSRGFSVNLRVSRAEAAAAAAEASQDVDRREGECYFETSWSREQRCCENEFETIRLHGVFVVGRMMLTSRLVVSLAM